MQNCHYPTIYKWDKHHIYRPSWSVCLFSRSVMPDSLRPCPWDVSCKNTGEGCHFLLQGILPTQGWNPCLLLLLYWQADSLSTEPWLLFLKNHWADKNLKTLPWYISDSSIKHLKRKVSFSKSSKDDWPHNCAKRQLTVATNKVQQSPSLNQSAPLSPRRREKVQHHGNKHLPSSAPIISC